VKPTPSGGSERAGFCISCKGFGPFEQGYFGRFPVHVDYSHVRALTRSRRIRSIRTRSDISVVTIDQWYDDKAVARSRPER